MNSSSLPILYTFRRCPYAMRARMAISIAGIEMEHREVSLKDKPQSLLTYSPKGTVPVVVTTNGQVIDQSRDIMLWALQQADPDHWLLLNDVVAQTQMAQLIDMCDTQFKPLLDKYKYFDRYPEYSQQDYRQQAEFFLAMLNQRLVTDRFLMDANMRLVDAAIFPFIRQFASVDSQWFDDSQYQHLQRWLTECVNSDVFTAIMVKPQI